MTTKVWFSINNAAAMGDFIASLVRQGISFQVDPEYKSIDVQSGWFVII